MCVNVCLSVLLVLIGVDVLGLHLEMGGTGNLRVGEGRELEGS